METLLPRTAAQIMGIPLLILAMSLAGTVSAEEASREYKIKAAYLYNLIKFVNWPEELASTENNGSQNTTAETDITICVYGENPFGTYLNQLSERQAKNRAINVLYIHTPEAINNCQLLYVSRNTEEIPAILSSIKETPILSIGETTEFTNNGGIVALIIKNNNVQLQINLTQAKSVGFEISGNLLEIARLIR